MRKKKEKLSEEIVQQDSALNEKEMQLKDRALKSQQFVSEFNKWKDAYTTKASDVSLWCLNYQLEWDCREYHDDRALMVIFLNYCSKNNNITSR